PLREIPAAGATGDGRRELCSREPAPDDDLEFREELEHFLAQLSEEERLIVQLRLAGCRTEEICTRLGTYDRKVRRVLERIQARAEHEVESCAAGDAVGW